MSLVLNTNESGGGGYELSNEFLGRYPDFRGSILIFLDGAINCGGNTGIDNGTFVANVNGTKINFWGGTLIAPNYFYGKNNSNSGEVANCGFGCTSTAITTKRIGVQQTLEGGEIIGKKIIFGQPYSTVNVIGNTASGSGYIKYTVNLLHTDGTITAVGTHTFNYSGGTTASSGGGSFIQEGGSSSTTGWISNCVFDSGTILVEGPGVVAQAGDYVVLDVECECSSRASGNYRGIGVHFGWKDTNNARHRVNPVQISIE